MALDEVGAYVVADGLGVPAGSAKQGLRAARSGVFGQVPAILTVDVGQQVADIGGCGTARLDATEAVRDPVHQVVEGDRPPVKVTLSPTASRDLQVPSQTPNDHLMAVFL